MFTVQKKNLNIVYTKCRNNTLKIVYNRASTRKPYYTLHLVILQSEQSCFWEWGQIYINIECERNTCFMCYSLLASTTTYSNRYSNATSTWGTSAVMHQQKYIWPTNGCPIINNKKKRFCPFSNPFIIQTIKHTNKKNVQPNTMLSFWKNKKGTFKCIIWNKSCCTLAKTASIHINCTIQMTMIATTTMTTYETLTDMYTECKTENAPTFTVARWNFTGKFQSFQ